MRGGGADTNCSPCLFTVRGLHLEKPIVISSAGTEQSRGVKEALLLQRPP